MSVGQRLRRPVLGRPRRRSGCEAAHCTMTTLPPRDHRLGVMTVRSAPSGSVPTRSAPGSARSAPGPARSAAAPARKPKPEPSRTALVRRARKINRELAELYPDAHTELDFRTPLELLVATILSAQTTDKGVNQITPVLFAKYRTAADCDEIEKIIKPTGFFRAKTTAIIGLGQGLCDRFGGEVPRRLKDLVTLP